MNILFLDLTRLSPQKGGIARVIHSLRYFLEAKGHTTFLAFFDDQAKDCKEVQSGAFQFPDQQNRTSASNLRYLVDLIEKHQIQYVINNTLPDEDLIKLTARLKKCLPAVRLIHLVHSVPDYVLRNARNQIAGFWQAEKKKLKPFLRWLTKDLYLYLLEGILRRRLQKAYSSADAVVLLSSSYIKTFQKVARLKECTKFHILPDPVDPQFNARPLPPEQKLKRIIYVGRIDKEKAVHRLLLVWDKLYSRLPEWSLILLGDGPLKTSCEELSTKLGLERITFAGFQDPVSYINESSILCLTSNFEGFGLVLTEAQTLGTIPFSFNSYGAVYDIIDHRQNGMIIPAFDLDTYAEALYEVATAKEIRKQMSAAALKKATSFSLETVGERWIELFKELGNKQVNKE